jgi:ribonuclease D
MSYSYIETATDLAALCEQLKRSDWLTLDTEFIREETYYPQLCLIQVATDEVIACVDPLAIDDLGPLMEVFYDPAITKVLHAARQDLEIFQNLRGAPPENIFDTQIAATLLGQGDQVGYGNLVKAMLGVELDKAHSRTDWSKRPLSPEQLDYAADDVRYLRDIYKQQRQQLAEMDRLRWLEEDFAQLSNPAIYEPDTRDAWKRLKGINRLKGVQLAIVRELAQWREELARERNLPKRWILHDDLLVEVARLRPLSEDKLRHIRGLDDKKIARHGKTLLQLVEKAKSLPKEQWPTLDFRPRLSAEQDAMVDILLGMLKLCAHQHHVSPNSLATRKELELLIAGSGETALLHGWRHELCGASLEHLLSGRLCITIEQGTPTINEMDDV